MTAIPYIMMRAVITAVWLAIRVWWWKKEGFRLRRELELLLVYICVIVVARFTFLPFAKVDGKLQPLLFDPALIFPPRINLVPLVHLLEYPEKREALINVIGNTAMFIPLGIVWPVVYKKLDRPRKVICAGVGVSLAVEVLQLPFFDRVSDIDDLLLNSLGFLLGYGIWLLATRKKRKGQ